MRLHAQEDGVRRQTGQTPLDIRLAPQLLGLSVQVVQRPHRLLKLLLVDLENTQRDDDSGLETKRRCAEQGHVDGGVRLLSASAGIFPEETCPISSRFPPPLPTPCSFHVQINEGLSCVGAVVHQGRAGPPSQAGNTPWSD